MDELFNQLCSGIRKDHNVKIIVDGKTMPVIITNMETDHISYERRMKIKLEGLIERFSSTGNGVSNTPFNMMYEKIIFNKPATIVIWKDGSKTVVGNFNNILKAELPAE